MVKKFKRRSTVLTINELKITRSKKGNCKDCSPRIEQVNASN